MRARRSASALLCAGAVLLLLPGGGAAKPGYVVKSKDLDLHFEVPAGNGYEIEVDTDGHRRVTLRVEKGSFFASYTTLGRVSHRGIKADFGKLGKISLRFQGKKRIRGPALPRSLRPECKGRPTVRERGIFRGSLRFEGERGFTKAVAHRLKGTVTRSYKRICKDRGGARASKAKAREELIILEAVARRLGTLRFLTAIEVSLPGESGRFQQLTIGVAGQWQKPNRVSILKGVFLIDRGSSIEIGPRSQEPVAAEVTMPKPFEGTASYLEEDNAPPTWTGTFGIRLPGSGLVPLTGPEFEAALCRATSEAEIDRCIEQELKLRLLYGSGSHSQPLALARLSSLR